MAKATNPSVQALAAIAERMIRDMENHSGARRMQAEVNRIHGGAAALHDVAANRSPVETPEAHALKVAKLARKFDSEVTASINRAVSAYQESLQDTQRRIDERVNLKPDAFASEIRSAFRTLDSSAKAKLIKQLVKENRGPELAAIVKAPSVLTGISDEQRAAYEQSIIGMHAAAEVNELEKLDDVWGAFDAAVRASGGIVKSLTDPSKLAEIERGAAAADAASDAFNQSLQ